LIWLQRTGIIIFSGATHVLFFLVATHGHDPNQEKKIMKIVSRVAPCIYAWMPAGVKPEFKHKGAMVSAKI
jgi:hypothetical protein